MEEEILGKYQHVYNYEADRQRKFRALIILISSFLVFLLTVLGLTDWFSELTFSYLEKNLGFTNKWSKSFGPEWFVGLNKDIAALGGFSLLFIFLIISIVYYHLRKENRRLWRLLFIVIVGGTLMLITKSIFTIHLPDDPIEIIINSISPFPSGHAMMGIIFYTTLGVTIARRQHSHKIKIFIIVASVIITILIGIARVLPNSHTLTEVLAGWSLGLTWLSMCWLLERYIKKNRVKKSALTELPDQ